MKSVVGLKRTKRRKHNRLLKEVPKKLDCRFKTYFIHPDEIESFDIKKGKPIELTLFSVKKLFKHGS